MPEDFVLHPSLVKDSVELLDWPLCRVLLMNDSHYPWLVLVPRRPGLRDLDDLAEVDRTACLEEMLAASTTLKRLTDAEKMNVAALGNVCPQLHIHVIARFASDAAWPRPVWGVHPALPYEPAALERLTAGLREALTAAARS